MTPTLTAPDPAIFPADVLAFAAERGVTEYLTPLYELTRRCFPGAAVDVVFESDYEITGLHWIVFGVGVRDWDFGRYRAAKAHWIEELVRSIPPAARQPFALRMR
jgi:hypothetical protein